MKWEPIDILRLAAMVGGFLMCVLGAWLMWRGVGAEGTVDIKSSILSGTIKSGSAGLFIIFFGFFIVVFVLATLTTREKSGAATTSQRSRAHGIGVAFYVLLGCTIVAGGIGSFGLGPGFVFLAFGCGLGALMAGAMYMDAPK